MLLVRNNSVPYSAAIDLQELQLFDMEGQLVGGAVHVPLHGLQHCSLRRGGPSSHACSHVAFTTRPPARACQRACQRARQRPWQRSTRQAQRARADSSINLALALQLREA